MSASNEAVPEPFSSQDYDRRVDGVVSSAAEQGLAGVIVMPGVILRNGTPGSAPQSRKSKTGRPSELRSMPNTSHTVPSSNIDV